MLEIPTVSADIVLTSRVFAGQSLRELVDRLGARGIFLIALTRDGRELPFTASTTIERGDILRVSGTRAEVARVAAEIGYAEYPTTATDLLLVAGTISAGALIGLPAFIAGGFSVSLTSPVGVLCGADARHLRSTQPRFGRIPRRRCSCSRRWACLAFWRWSDYKPAGGDCRHSHIRRLAARGGRHHYAGAPPR